MVNRRGQRIDIFGLWRSKNKNVYLGEFIPNGLKRWERENSIPNPVNTKDVY